MKTIIRYLVTILFFSIASIGQTQITDYIPTDVVFFKQGKVLKGQILDMTSKDGLLFRTKQGVEMLYPYKGLRKLIRQPSLKDMMTASYGEIGISFGTPAFLNFSAGFWSGKIGFRLSGMVYGSDISAVQAMAGIKLSDNNRRRHSLGLAFGRYGSYGESFNYFGPVYNYTGPPFSIKKMTNAWFVEIGYAIGFGGDNESSNGSISFPLLQIGYMFRFIPHAPRNERIPIPFFSEPPPCPDCPVCPEISKEEKETLTEKKALTNNIISKKELSERVVALPIIVRIKKPQIRLSIWDNGIADNDIISIQLNGHWILQEQLIGKEKIHLDVELKKGQDNFLIMHAHNIGRRSPNTAAMTIQDAYQSKTITLQSDLKNSSSVKFVIKK